MIDNINEVLTVVEVVLINEESPDYIEVSYQSGFIYCLLSKYEYKYYRLSERLLSVFEVLKTFCPDILEDYPFIIETLDSDEMTEMLKFYGNAVCV